MTPPALFPFFVGCGRSGTTLLRTIFDAHPEIAIPDESYFVVDLSRRAARYQTEAGIDVTAFLADLGRHPFYRQWDLDHGLVEKALVGAPPPRDFPEAIRAVFGAYAESRGKSICGDKTPSYVMHMPRLAALFPEARFVQLVRDGRDVALAFRDTPFGPTSIEEAALHWRSRVLRGRTDGEQLGDDRYMEARYEDLVADTEAVTRRLCGFLGVEFRPEMLDYRGSAQTLVASVVHPASHRHLLSPPTKGLRDWRRQMSALEAQRFEILAGDALDAFGYERLGRGPSLQARTGTWRRRLVLEIRRKRRRRAKRGSGWWW